MINFITAQRLPTNTEKLYIHTHTFQGLAFLDQENKK